jgi:senataxin
MHPEISKLPSQLFYAGNLLDGPSMDSKTKQPWHEHIKFGPYKFFNVRGNEELGLHHSLKNKAECNIAVALYSRLRKEYASLSFKIGIVSMYSAQVQELRRSFVQRFGQGITSEVSFSTVDGFQGQEKDIIVLSCVRAGDNLQKIGFLAGQSFSCCEGRFLTTWNCRHSSNECRNHSCEIISLYSW